MFLFYYDWIPNSKAAFVCLLAQVYQEVASFYSYNGEFNRKLTFRKNIKKKPFLHKRALQALKILFLDHFTIDICHITIKKWSQICQNSIIKGFFWKIECWCLFSIDIPIIAFKTYHHPQNSTHRSKSGVLELHEYW